MQEPSVEQTTHTSRRSLLSLSAAVAGFAALPKPSFAGLFGGKSLQGAFEAAMKVQNDPVALEAAWTECIKIAPTNAALYGNRGTVRLGLKMFQGAKEDLEKAQELEKVAYGYASGFTMVALGNARGALGDWEAALADFATALEDEYPGVSTLANASAALAKFELKKDGEAVEMAKSVLEEASDYQDIQAALAGLKWAMGDKRGAQADCDAIGGNEVLQNFVKIEQDTFGWPPRTIAAVNAFLSGSRNGTATGYDGVSRTYTF
eukprot:CAMPEP_0198207924 /NCGR_PEP_ID=MMETSP1445-20131203/11331_1 /TAXON_ID=36898 /ORGANISM="Pyramimonas sp., Strain CCMP2087" /LENGTH=262 /DNA_ID=CAMNT_0043881113 /DNA_START=295 /DNA_END=1083 /DNA_ORIENTATION=+